MKPKTTAFILLQHLLPQHLLSRLAGQLANSHRLRLPFIRWFIRKYRVDLSEAAVQQPAEFACFNDFFTRALAADARPLAAGDDTLLCPADGCISQLGSIDGDSVLQSQGLQNRALQAKGQFFSLAEMLGAAEDAEIYRGGTFVTVYLSPRDYHRVHSPLAARLLHTRYIPGRLFSVNQATTEAVANLFARNERLVCQFDTAVGPMAVVLVGAMIVAGIETVWGGRTRPGHLHSEDYRQQAEPPQLERGSELGRFLLGSTVIVLFPPGKVALAENLAAGSPVRMGQALGKVIG